MNRFGRTGRSHRGSASAGKATTAPPEVAQDTEPVTEPVAEESAGSPAEVEAEPTVEQVAAAEPLAEAPTPAPAEADTEREAVAEQAAEEPPAEPPATMQEAAPAAAEDEAETPEPPAAEPETAPADAAPLPSTAEVETESADEITEPLAVAQREDLTPLPVNALVDGRYIIQTRLHHTSERNLYRVSARRMQRCPVCGRLSPVDEGTCATCGSSLTGEPPAEFYLMAESYRPEALVQDPDLMALNLYHPSLVPVVDFFEYMPYGGRRYYALAEPRQGVRLSQLSFPRPAGQVLNWALQLADALDYLHTRGVVGAGAEADDILVQGDTAALASLQNARVTDEDTGEMTQQSVDLARLAGTIYEAYTGHPPTMSPEGILTMPPGAPEQIGAAFRAAIEPVQGSAPPISVNHWRKLLADALEALAELERPSRPVSFVSARMTDVGRLREQNQDSLGIIEYTQSSDERPMNVGLYVVCDGLGGHKGGEIASSMGVQAFCGEVMGRIIAPIVASSGDRNPPSNEAILQALTRAVQTANERIYKARNTRQNDMGTTLVAALISGGKAFIVNVGDSRLYLYTRKQVQAAADESPDSTRPLAKGTTTPLETQAYLRRLGKAGAPSEDPGAGAAVVADRSSNFELQQISIDHSLVHRLVELGQIDAEEAKVHPHRNFIYRSLGGPPPVEIDTFIRTLHPGDRLLLCSDGLNSMVEDSDIEGVLASEDDTQAACRRLVEIANEAGGHDNITALLIDVTDYLPYGD